MAPIGRADPEASRVRRPEALRPIPRYVEGVIELFDKSLPWPWDTASSLDVSIEDEMLS
jgi:hypothetical protein